MKQLYKTVPSFASDATGAYSVGYEMGGAVIMHDPGGCFGHCGMVDDLRWNYDVRPSYTVALREFDTIVGSDAKVVQKVVNAMEATGVSFAILIGTPVTMLTGADLPAIAKLAEKKCGKPVVGVQTDCLHFYEDGQSKTYLALIQKFAEAPENVVTKKKINVIGATPFDMWDTTSLDDIELLLHQYGYEEVSIWGYGGPEEIASAGEASLNLAVSVSGLPAVKKLQEMYGTPYVTGFPIGAKQLDSFRMKLEGIEKMEVPTEKELEMMQIPAGVERVLIVGEQIHSNAMRECMKKEYGIQNIDVVSFFRMDSEFMEGQDAYLDAEDTLQEYVDRNGPYDLVFGDVLLKPLFKSEPEYYVDTPHMAVSGALGCQTASNYIGKKGTEYFDELWKVLAEMKRKKHDEETKTQ